MRDAVAVLARGWKKTSPRIFSKTEGRIDVEAVGELELKGFDRAVPAYNVVGIREDRTP